MGPASETRGALSGVPHRWLVLVDGVLHISYEEIFQKPANRLLREQTHRRFLEHIEVTEALEAYALWDSLGSGGGEESSSEEPDPEERKQDNE